MTKKILINATQAEELRVAIVDDGGTLFDLDIEISHRVQKKANIYKAKVSRIEQSLNAIFVDYGAERHGFLPMKELAPMYMTGGKPNIKEGQEILIQIEKEERGTKGAAVTTFITLAGCYLVLMPNSNKSGGVSRRIEGEDRQQLKDLLGNLNVPSNMSVIARTACLGRTQEELQWDLDSLLKLWDTIITEEQKHAAPFLIYQESDVIMRSVRDYLRQDIDEILVDERKTYERVLQYVKTLRPDFEERVRFYHHDIGLFTYYRIESQIETAFLREVKLPSGGSIVIDHTEALTSIDINSSKATKGGDIEETALQTNLEAAREIARQMKIRDLGGLLVIDFIDMENNKNQRLVEEELDRAIKSDRARIQLSKISRFGLLELSRQRLRPSLDEASGNTCPRCNGQGTIRSVESISLSIVRLLQEESMRADTHEIHVELPLAIMVFLGNEKRHLITQIEVQNKVRIVLIPNPNLESPNYNLSRVTALTDDDKLSYQMQVPRAIDTYQPTNARIEAQEQPAIRALSIEKAPSSPNMLKRTISGLFSKIQEVFTAPEEQVQKSGRDLNIKNKVGHNRRSNNQQRRDRNGENRGNENRNNRQERNDRRNNNDRRNRPERNNDQRQEQGERQEQRQERRERSERSDRPNRQERTPRSPQPKLQPLAAETIAMPLIIEFPAASTTTEVPNPTTKISPQVQAILNENKVVSNSQQVESSLPKTDIPTKIAREESVTQTEFSLENARETVKKQHEKKGIAVETTIDSGATVTQKYAKEEQVL